MTVIYKKDELKATDELAKVAEAIRRYMGNRKGSVEVPVKVPGAYNVYAAGTSGDVTILVWLHGSGDVIVKEQDW